MNPPWWAWLSMWSLEGVAFVSLARLTMLGQTPEGLPLTLGWGLWFLWSGYVLDRYTDASFTEGGEVTWRHRFHINNIKLLGGLGLFGFAVLLKITLSQPMALSAEQSMGLGIALLVGLVILGIPRIHKNSVTWWTRAVLIALLLGFMVHDFRFRTVGYDVVPLVLLALANLVILRQSELRTPPKILAMMPWVAIGSGLFCLARTRSVNLWLAWAAVWGGFGLWVLGRRMKSDSLEHFRAKVDAVTLLALLLGAIGAYLARGLGG